jgi:hypothetical protein
MRNTILIALVCFVFSGCKKDTYSSTPQLTYKSVNTNQLYPDQIIKFTLTVTDAEGDIIDTMYIQKVSLNCPGSDFSATYPVPTFPTSKNLKSDVLISFANGINTPPYITVASACSYNDTCYFRFMIKDQANHKSDTVRSGNIVIFK